MCSYSRVSHLITFCIYKYIIWVRPSFQCRGRAERTARVVRMVPGPAFLANEFDILFEVRFHSRTHSSSDPSYPSLFARGDLFSHRCDTGTLTRLVLHLPLPPFPRHSFSPRRSSWRHFEVPSSPSSRRTARTTGSSSSRCSCARRSSCTATTSKLGTFLFIYLRMGNCTDDAVFYLLILLQGE